MGRIINTFKKGSTKAKLYLALTFATGFLACMFVVLSLVLSELLFFFGAIIMAFVAISLAQSFGIHECDVDENKNNTEDIVRNDNVSDREMNPNDVNFLDDLISHQDEAQSNVDTDGQSDELAACDDIKEKHVKTKKNKKAKKAKKTQKAKKVKKVKQVKEAKEDKSPKKKKEKYANKSNLYDGHPEFLEKHMKSASKTEETVKETVEKVELTEEELAKKVEVISETEAKVFTKKKIKKTLHRFKVKRDHRTVMIDSCKKYNINQTPAYIWVNDKTFNILLIEKEPRHLQIPVYSLREMKYLKKQPANPDIDFGVYKGNNLLTHIFGPYVPDYTHSTVMDDLTAYKNLYGIGPDIYFTNRSAKNLIELLPVEFIVEDKVTTSNKVNVYFKDAYKSNILLRDNVIDANGYADRISSILDSMAKSSISNNEFRETLKLMIKNKLITEEFASYYQDVRDKQLR